ncbi:unnamed protein product [Phytophthora fragariaefolia]|uniref:Unnamed protein product n=1 Tax=Phytophthora fragariaefolia TaxID=1490495 RepID=A0A9W6Y3S0_9STRA|nr:unnamed protein product [Phytophthora fragariaefolia]
MKIYPGRFSIRSPQIAPLKALIPTTTPREIELESHLYAPTVSNPSAKKLVTTEEQVELVREAAQTLFYCEYLVLIEYVECVIPIIYGLYMQMLYRFGGNARLYYPQTRDLTLEKLNSTVGNLVVYVWLELLSLLILHIVLHRRFGFSILRQLAFMLETDAYQVQGRLLTWILYTVSFTLQHFGTHQSVLVMAALRVIYPFVVPLRIRFQLPIPVGEMISDSTHGLATGLNAFFYSNYM